MMMEYLNIGSFPFESGSIFMPGSSQRDLRSTGQETCAAHLRRNDLKATEISGHARVSARGGGWESMGREVEGRLLSCRLLMPVTSAPVSMSACGGGVSAATASSSDGTSQLGGRAWDETT